MIIFCTYTYCQFPIVYWQSLLYCISVPANVSSGPCPRSQGGLRGLCTLCSQCHVRGLKDPVKVRSNTRQRSQHVLCCHCLNFRQDTMCIHCSNAVCCTGDVGSIPGPGTCDRQSLGRSCTGGVTL